MRPTATTGTFGRTLLAALCAIFFMACSDSSDQNGGNSGGSVQPSQSGGDAKAIPSKYLARTIAIRDGDGWQIHVNLPNALPEGAQVTKVTCQTTEETHTWTKTPEQSSASFHLNEGTPGYEVVITGSKGGTFVTKATFE